MNYSTQVPALFGTDVFNETTMKERLDPEVFGAWKTCVSTGSALTLGVANKIAEAMKTWAIEKGATHFTHWFQPMTGFTAEKHDSFIDLDKDGQAIMSFSGKSLVRSEPDASSFPSGGLRTTFEARGYTAWDPTSFAFVKDGSLYIPCCFFSYTGAALDKKTPLLRSTEALSREAVRILRLFGDNETQKVNVCVGSEQEYFLIPRALFEKRLDLRLTGRTLFGAPAPKGQEMQDHYYGTLRTRVGNFMHDLDVQLWRLGIPAKTKHNEVAPCQHELAPIYTDVSRACDANQLTMEVMKKVASRHDLVCLLHEKPFAGVNGSGKHNNWSLSTDSGKNLFSPGKTPRQNAQFLVFLAAFLAGIDDYPEFLRSTVAFAGNDYRLGGDEAPPAIISVFLGDELTAVVDSIIHGSKYSDPKKRMMRIGVDVLPSIPKDTTDRNRTSPVAFTGNKFEFRSPGSSQSIAGPNIAMNTIMAEELSRLADVLEKAEDFDSTLQALVCDVFTAHQRIIFNGYGYGEEWKEEAARRGLPNLHATPDVLPSYVSKKNLDLVKRHKIFSPEEFIARQEIHAETYCKVVRIEARTCVDMATRQFLPAAMKYTGELTNTLLVKEQAGLPVKAERALVEQLSQNTDDLYAATEALSALLEAVPDRDAAEYFHDRVIPAMNEVRRLADALELRTPKSYWPVPTYSDILFY